MIYIYIYRISCSFLLLLHYIFITSYIFAGFLPRDKVVVASKNNQNGALRRQNWLCINYSFVECDLRNLDAAYFLDVLADVFDDKRPILESAQFSVPKKSD